MNLIIMVDQLFLVGRDRVGKWNERVEEMNRKRGFEILLEILLRGSVEP